MRLGRFGIALRGWLTRCEPERRVAAVLADARLNGEFTPAGYVRRVAEEHGWPSGELYVFADGATCFLESPAVPIAHEEDPNRRGESDVDK